MDILNEYKNSFRNVYWHCKEEIAYSKINSLNNLSTKNKLSVPSNQANLRGAKEIIECFSQVIRNKILEAVDKTDFLGISLEWNFQKLFFRI